MPGNTAMRMAEKLPRLPTGEAIRVYFGNSTSSADLAKEIKCIKLLSVATIRRSRINGCTLIKVSVKNSIILTRLGKELEITKLLCNIYNCCL